MNKLIGCAFALALALAGCTANRDTGGIDFGDEVAGEITVSCYVPFPGFLEDAAKAFGRKYPGAKVVVENFSPPITIKVIDGDRFAEMPEDKQAEQDYIQRINVELMAGKGADVYSIDIIPYTKYADGGFLSDLRPFMDADPGFDIADYRENILEAVKYKGGQYIFPLRYEFSYFAYDSSLFTQDEKKLLAGGTSFTFGELVDIGKNAFERNGNTYMFGYSGDKYTESNMFRAILDANYASFVDMEKKQAYFADGRFARLLESVREYHKKGYIKNAGDIEYWYFWGGDAALRPTDRFFYKLEDSGTLLAHFNEDMPKGKRIYRPASGNVDDDVIAGMAAGEGGGITFSIYDAYAVNSNSANKRAAWEFIKFMAGEQMQGLPSAAGISINKKAFEARTRLNITGSVSREYTEAQQQAYDGYAACIDKFSGMINSYAIRDGVLDGMIEEEVKAYFDGEKTADEAARVLQNKAELYLSE
jgi:multiple sugar transport system substrate-binding protein